MTISKSGQKARSLLAQTIDLALLPLRAALSPIARRAYLSSALVFLASAALVLASTVAYILFYYAYVPHAAVSVPVHLQYAHPVRLPSPECNPGCEPLTKPAMRHHPWGMAPLHPPLASRQKYDVSVVLEMPRSPTNLAAGNFMVEVALLAPGAPAGAGSDEEPARMLIKDDERTIIYEKGGEPRDDMLAANAEGMVARARRPALLRYASAHVDLLRKALALPWYILGWAQEREVLEVGMLENVEFTTPSKTRRLRIGGGGGGSGGVPDRVRVVLESRDLLEVYNVRVEIRARLRGLRWIMYNHRILSFVVFTAAFFGATMGAAVVVYVGLTIWQIVGRDDRQDIKSIAGNSQAAIKEEEEDEQDESLSDTSRSFPTRHGREPLRYSSRGRQVERDSATTIKKEEEENGAVVAAVEGAGLAAEADDEDDGEDYDEATASWRDSGIGTSLEEANARGARRRKKRLGPGSEWDIKDRLPGL